MGVDGEKERDDDLIDWRAHPSLLNSAIRAFADWKESKQRKKRKIWREAAAEAYWYTEREREGKKNHGF